MARSFTYIQQQAVYSSINSTSKQWNVGTEGGGWQLCRQREPIVIYVSALSLTKYGVLVNYETMFFCGPVGRRTNSSLVNFSLVHLVNSGRGIMVIILHEQYVRTH